MSENLVRLSGTSTAVEASAEFQRVIAGHVECFVQQHGHEPQSLVFVLGDSDGNFKPSWLMRGNCEGHAAGQIAIASVMLGQALMNTAE